MNNQDLENKINNMTSGEVIELINDTDTIAYNIGNGVGVGEEVTDIINAYLEKSDENKALILGNVITHTLEHIGGRPDDR